MPRLLWTATGAVAAIAFAAGDLLVTVLLVWATFLTMKHAGHSWHGTILLGAGLGVGVARPKVPVPFLRNVVALWIFGLWQLAFDNPLFAVVNDVVFRAKFK
jgi:hypothetical protein